MHNKTKTGDAHLLCSRFELLILNHSVHTNNFYPSACCSLLLLLPLLFAPQVYPQ